MVKVRLVCHHEAEAASTPSKPRTLHTRGSVFDQNECSFSACAFLKKGHRCSSCRVHLYGRLIGQPTADGHREVRRGTGVPLRRGRGHCEQQCIRYRGVEGRGGGGGVLVRFFTLHRLPPDGILTTTPPPHCLNHLRFADFWSTRATQRHSETVQGKQHITCSSLTSAAPAIEQEQTQLDVTSTRGFMEGAAPPKVPSKAAK